MFSALRSRTLGSMTRNLLALTACSSSHPAVLRLPVRQQGWWTPPGGGGVPPDFRSRWIKPDKYELTVNMGPGSGGVSYKTVVGPHGEINITAKWGDGQVVHLTHTLPPGVDPSSVQTTLGEDGIVRITAKIGRT